MSASSKRKVVRDTFLCGYGIPVRYRDLDKEQAEGLYYPGEMVIELDSGLDATKQVEVFLHEAIEAVNSMYDLNLPHAKIQVLGLGLFEMLSTAGVLKKR